MELWNLEHCENPDDSVKTGATQGRNYRCERMPDSSYAVRHAVHHAAQVVGCHDYPEAAYSCLDNFGTVREKAYKLVSEQKEECA